MYESFINLVRDSFLYIHNIHSHVISEVPFISSIKTSLYTGKGFLAVRYCEVHIIGCFINFIKYQGVRDYPWWFKVTWRGLNLPLA